MLSIFNYRKVLRILAQSDLALILDEKSFALWREIGHARSIRDSESDLLWIPQQRYGFCRKIRYQPWNPTDNYLNRKITHEGWYLIFLLLPIETIIEAGRADPYPPE